MALTPKMRKFAAVYAGNATEAARLAGYAGDDHTLAQVGRENLRKPEIAELIRQREDIELRPLIATRQERQEFWTSVMDDPLAEMAMRLKASELLGKSEADFTDKVDVKGGMSIRVIDPYAEKPEEK